MKNLRRILSIVLLPLAAACSTTAMDPDPVTDADTMGYYDDYGYYDYYDAGYLDDGYYDDDWFYDFYDYTDTDYDYWVNDLYGWDDEWDYDDTLIE
ncbi:MAG: hypothetical protein A2603_11510 [Bdellovibrionales bacterium RIFOXYD1_FULL_55_31]|nr:MAG: hypothetical protein A2603_11510 [Bdellovibrionales bacterium RIFOXYD1_FULL_55_31]